jgi:hypothetical protein
MFYPRPLQLLSFITLATFVIPKKPLCEKIFEYFRHGSGFLSDTFHPFSVVDAGLRSKKDFQCKKLSFG